MSAPTAQEVQERALRDGISELMQRCTEKQVARLHSIHAASPWGSLDKCPADKLPITYELLRRTVIGNGSKAAKEPTHG